MLAELMRERDLMPVWDEKTTDWESRRKEIAELLCREEYGFMPKTHDKMTWAEETAPYTFCAGRAEHKKVTLTVHFGEDAFSFPIYTSIPKKAGKLPFFVLLNFRDSVPDQYLPVEEICDRGYAVISFCYNDVTEDRPTKDLASDPLMEILYKGIEKQPWHAGKLRVWAWAASRALDYALTLDTLDPARAFVVGHSRLGKAALVAGMLDERFELTISNDSGCSGAAVSRGKKGETVKRITEVFPHWFCENYYNYAGKEADMPFDQHFLVAAMAPRYVYAASAEEDEWADPESEYLSCYGAGQVYARLGLPGFVCEDRLPRAGDICHEGRIGYHMRTGAHFLSREDWNRFMDYADMHFRKV